MPTTGRDYPGSYAELMEWFPDEAACLDYLEWLRWPDRDPLLPLHRTGRLAAREWTMGVRDLRASGFGDGGDDLPSHPHAVAAVVRCRVADDKPEARCLGARGAALAWARLLPDGVGDAAPLSSGDGAPRPRTPGRACRGRRGLPRRRGGQGTRARNPDQGDRCDRCGDRESQGIRADPAGSRPRRHGRQPAPVHRRSGRPRRERPHRRLAGVLEPARPRLRARADDHAPAERPRTRRHARRAPRREPASAGCLAPTRAASAPRTSSPTSTSTPSASTAAAHAGAACFSTGCSNRPSSPSRSPIAALSPTRPQPAADRRSRPDPVESPPSRPLIAPGAKPPTNHGTP